MSSSEWRYWILPATAVIAGPAFSHDYLSIDQAQSIIFPKANTFSKKSVTLSEEQRDQIKELSGVRQRSDQQQIWRVSEKEQFLGWFLVDDVVGKHEFITYAVGISPEGRVLGVEILSYRETHGGEVRQEEWRKNFVGKVLTDKFKLDVDVPNISGATLSCRNINDGVKRLLSLHKVVLMNEKL